MYPKCNGRAECNRHAALNRGFSTLYDFCCLLLVQCYVVSTGKSGCFVRLAGGVSGRVLLKLLSDRYVSNPALEFPCGRLVAGKVLEKVGVWMGWLDSVLPRSYIV